MKKTILALTLASALFSSAVIAAPTAKEIALGQSIKAKFTEVAKYNITSEHQQLEGRVLIHFENGGFKIKESSNNAILDDNASQIAMDTIAKMTDEEKAMNVIIPLNFALIVPNTWCIGAGCPHYSAKEKEQTRKLMGDKYHF